MNVGKKPDSGDLAGASNTDNPKDLALIIDAFPAYQLHNTHLFVRRCQALQEGISQIDSRALNRVFRVKDFTDHNIGRSQIKDALAVLRAIYFGVDEDLFGGCDISVPPKSAPAFDVGGEVIKGVTSVSLVSIDEELSKREGVIPVGGKIPICFSALGGIYRCDRDDEDLRYRIRGNRLKYAEALFQRSPMKWSDLASDLRLELTDVVKNNLVRDIQAINNVSRKRLDLPKPLIVATGAGYRLNTESYTFTRA